MQKYLYNINMWNPKDYYFKKAKQNGYKARSVFKLEEIDKKYHILKKNDIILDIGCAPGSFLQYASKKVGTNGLCIGIDLKKVDLDISNIQTHTIDINDKSKLLQMIKSQDIHKFDNIISDIAPQDIGNKR